MSQDTPKPEAFGPWAQAPASAQQEALEGTITLEQAASHAHICSKLAEQYKSDPVLFAALTDAAAIIRDLLDERDALARENETLREALKDEFHSLHKWAETSWNRGFRQGLESNRLLATQAMDALKKEREAHAETNRAMTDALLMMEEREQRDEALLRQALEALESSDWYMEQLELIVYSRDDTGTHDARAKVQSTITALRERLGEGEQQ